MKRGILKAVSVALGMVLICTTVGCGRNSETGNTTPTTDVSATPEVTQGPEDIKKLSDYSGTTGKSTGSNQGKVVLWEKEVQPVFAEEIHMNSLSFEGGDGYLELPEDVFTSVTDGFTIAFLVKNDSEVNGNARIFQANLCGYSVGDQYWRDAPEISLAADGTVRIFAGGRTIGGVYNPIATYNNGGSNDDKAYAEPKRHKTRYTGRTTGFSADSWTEVVFSVSKDGFKVFTNGNELIYTEDEAEEGNIASTLEYLFGSYEGGTNLLKQYINVSFGNSVYSDCKSYKGSIANIRFFDRMLSADEIKTANAVYNWSFAADTLNYNEMTSNYEVVLDKYMGESALTESLKVVSPDGKCVATILQDEKKGIFYHVTVDGKVIVENSRLGFVFNEGELWENLEIVKTESKEINETYDNITGCFATAENHCKETKITVVGEKGSFVLVFRAYDDGVAYKYEDVKYSDGKTVTVKDELSEVLFTPGVTTWSFALNGTYEGEFIRRSANSLKSLSATLSTPFLAQNGDYYCLVTEAAVFNNDGQYCASALKTTGGTRALEWTFGLKRDPAHETTGELDQPGHLEIQRVFTKNGFNTPWRVLVISNDLNTFTTTDIISNLNPAPSEELFGDIDWIKPGKVAWSWWSADNSQGRYTTHVSYIDFASANGWEYVCMDAYWRNFEKRLPEICKYAEEKNVGLFVWVNYRDIKNVDDMDYLFSQWAAAGVKGLKTDYFESDDCDVLLVMQQVAEVAAKYHLMVLYHGCVRPGGEYRTYPNILTMEAVQGEENHKWSQLPTIYNSLLYPFTRNICGSMDYTPTAIAIPNSEAKNGFELAMTVVYESGLQHLAYSASGYKKYNGLSFINHVPTVWDESILLEGEPGEYAAFARRNGEEWFLGTMTNKARRAEYKLDFLGSGSYRAYIYADSDNGEKLVVSTRTVTRDDTLEFALSYAGGATVIFTKNEYKDCAETAK